MAHVLVIDDDPGIRLLLKSTLEADGWSVTECEDGQSGLKAFNESSPDVIVLDYMMPGMNGIDVATELRSRGHKQPIIFFSAYLSPELKEQSERLNLIACSKVDLNALFRLVRATSPEVNH